MLPAVPVWRANSTPEPSNRRISPVKLTPAGVGPVARVSCPGASSTSLYRSTSSAPTGTWPSAPMLPTSLRFCVAFNEGSAMAVSIVLLVSCCRWPGSGGGLGLVEPRVTRSTTALTAL